MANIVKVGQTQITSGDLVKVYLKVKEGDKTRLQTFEGIVIAIHGQTENQTFIVRKVTVGGVGVERIWPVNSPWIDKIVVLKRGDVRRAKLYYIRKSKTVLKFKGEKKESGKVGRTNSRRKTSKK